MPDIPDFRKMLPLGIVAILMVGVVVLLIFRQSQIKSPDSSTNLGLTLPSVASNDQPVEVRVKILEEAVTIIARKIGSTVSTGGQGNNSSEERIKTLEATVKTLQTQINDLKGLPATQITPTGVSNSNKIPVYIPLEWSGSTTSLDWTSLFTQSIFIDSADYPGATGVTLEASLKTSESGTAYARLYNKDDKTPIASSDVSTSSTDYNWVSSTSFKLTTGKKTYILQLKTSNGHDASLQNARLKISF